MKKFSLNLLVKVFISIFYFLVCNISSGQTFLKITDSNNPVVSDPGFTSGYIGTAWVDVDNDGWLDLYVCNRALYRNLHNGNFEKLTNGLETITNTLSTTWADYNNDGFIDCYVTSTGGSKSFLFRNNGNGTFAKITSGAIADSAYNTGWGCSWGDYNNDGFVDLIIAAANGFGVVNHPCRFWKNNGDGTFTKIDTTQFTMQNAPYTCPSFYDYDQDGDVDLFIGSGPATGTLARDFNFKNLLKETGNPFLQRIDTSIIGTDPVDGQVWNFIDYDNDGDLDAFLTNYVTNNNMYRNEGNGYYRKLPEAEIGNIVNAGAANLANLWGDFDNDGYLDCFVTKDGTPTNKFYHNNRNGTFTSLDTISICIVPGTHYGAAAGDYNKDGKLDIFVVGTNISKGLYQNIFPNSNKWVNIKCSGTTSNRSALGTRIKAKAVINGTPMWQTREINAANSFNSMNALNVHFGFGAASQIDSLVVMWPSGLKQTFTNVTLNNFYNLTEGGSLTSEVKTVSSEIPNSISLKQNYPNPFNPSTKIQFTINKSSEVSLKVFDVNGREVAELLKGNYSAGTYEAELDGNKYSLSSGVYFYTLSTSGYSETRKLNLIK
ncbi:MAG: FG-GAP-like repeat-containing protein [Ignavibacteria bacterium]|nr:FG-GAP-like repeat-containing protein [Ignavibacteria bacterium]